LDGVEDAEPGAPTLTKAGLVFGTPEYISPEQAMAHKADGRADLYAVGVILYELFTGKLPFVSKTLREILKDSIETRPIPLAEAAPGHAVPEAAERFLFKMLEKDPLVRPQTANDALALLSEARGSTRKKSRKKTEESPAAAKKGCFGLFFF
ncbi:hypothetical protein HY251_17950, partial [bacterium]|nr:hypothetical protein [bacterium]